MSLLADSLSAELCSLIRVITLFLESREFAPQQLHGGCNPCTYMSDGQHFRRAEGNIP